MNDHAAISSLTISFSVVALVATTSWSCSLFLFFRFLNIFVAVKATEPNKTLLPITPADIAATFDGYSQVLELSTNSVPSMQSHLFSSLSHSALTLHSHYPLTNLPDDERESWWHAITQLNDDDDQKAFD